MSWQHELHEIQQRKMQSLHLEQNQDRLGTIWETALQRLGVLVKIKWNMSQQCTLTLVKTNCILQSVYMGHVLDKETTRE